ncbi:MAG: hypothetical protein QOE55_1945 [Acidobacteriaceae bacterium]|jgi:hypothetical protein|nr:hypothetical protein [Acidobacteriaceae bacterium]
MSDVNVSRIVDNIRSNTTVYTPIVESIVNGIQAIRATGRQDGYVLIRAIRSAQSELNGALSEIVGFEIEDNGIGLDGSNRKSFDTLYSDYKINEGGKGFGRFTCLKYFRDVRFESVFSEKGKLFRRSFKMGRSKEIIEDESLSPSTESSTGTTVSLDWLREKQSIDKTLETVGRLLVEKLLPYFITSGYVCPRIELSEKSGEDRIVLNDFVSNQISSDIKEVACPKNKFSLKNGDQTEDFTVRIFKIFYPRTSRSKMSLVAHMREVMSTPLHQFIPEFSDEFYEKGAEAEAGVSKNYIVRAYIFGTFLDSHVSLERGSFEFSNGGDALVSIKQDEIEQNAAKLTAAAMGTEITARKEKKRKQVFAYVEDDAPWHYQTVKGLDLSTMPFNPSKEEMEIRLQEEKFKKDVQIKRDVNQILAGGSVSQLQADVSKVVEAISESGKNDLVHYVAMRRNVLSLLEKSLCWDEKGKYQSEGVVHNIIFPTRTDSERTRIEDHNLWLIDERLVFSSYVSSDVQINATDRPDLVIYDKRVMFRGDNEASNPITIFEFKKPYRDDFVDPSSKEDPVQQIIRYVNSIKDGDLVTPEGKKILVAANTPFYGYVICSLTQKVERWLEREKDFRPMPDRLGWFSWMSSNNLYIEVLSWDKVSRDAGFRNKIFFKHLGIS